MSQMRKLRPRKVEMSVLVSYSHAPAILCLSDNCLQKFSMFFPFQVSLSLSGMSGGGGGARWFFSARRGGDGSDCLQARPFSGWFSWWSPSSSCIFSAADSNLGEPSVFQALRELPESMGSSRLLAPVRRRCSEFPTFHLCPCCPGSGEPSSLVLPASE